MRKFKVRFLPDNLVIMVEENKTILSAAISAGIYLNSNCSGEGTCGKCKVVIKQGTVKTRPNGMISEQEKKDNVYLACLTTVQGELEVLIPESSRFDFDQLTPEQLQERLVGLYAQAEELPLENPKFEDEIFQHSPFSRKVYLELPKPTLNDSISDLERLYRSLRNLENFPVISTGIFNIRQLGELLRNYDWKVTVTLTRRHDAVEIVSIEPGDTSDKNFGFCFDIGTTTISGQLVNLNTNQVIGTKAASNPQAAFGSDVITRIVYAAQVAGLEKLHLMVSDTMNRIIQDLTAEYQIALNDVNCIVCSGNTTMIHLLLRMDPQHIRRHPYIPTANYIPVLPAKEAGIKINPRGFMRCVSGVASYVGGDVTAGVLSSRIYKQTDPCILIDIGTNGEIILGNRDFLVAAAASAGPAFEGSGVTSGMRAASGAIQKVRIDKKDLNVQYSTIQDKLPRGICGSGYIDLLSEMLSSGVIDKAGKIKVQGRRVRPSASGLEFVVCFKEDIQAQADIVINEADIENLKRSKAAIYSATAILTRHLELSFCNISKIFIAGGFGTYLDVQKAISIGLLPDLPLNKFIFIGNSSLAGAREILLSQQAMVMADTLAAKITYFELSVDPAYMDEYGQALFFPHTDLTKFPRVSF